MTRRNKLLLVWLLLFSNNTFAQNFEGVMPIDGPSLTSGTKVNSGSDIVNVDLYTGIGTVNIPIYSYDLEGLDLGISLNYGLKGIQVDQVASPIGLGWSLDAGGEIIKKPNGIEDEVWLVDNNVDLAYRGAFTSLFGSSSIDAKREQEYDEYKINLAGRAIDLIWTPMDGNQYYTYPKSELAVRTVNNGYYAHFPEFLNDFHPWSWPGPMFNYGGGNSAELYKRSNTALYIIDEHGNQFFFEPGDEELKEYNIPTTNNTSRYVVNKWVLTKVRSRNGNEVIFNYQKKYVSYAAALTEKIEEEFSVNGSVPASFNVISGTYVWRGYQSQLTSIIYPNGVKAIIHWDSTTNARCDQPGKFVVDSITIESKYDNNLKNTITYRLNHSYSRVPTTGDTSTEAPHGTACTALDQHGHLKLRLKLNSIDRIANDHTTAERYYTFGYHPTPLPGRNSYSKDFYGYYNNGATNTSSVSSGVPLHTYNNNYGSNLVIGTVRTNDGSQNLTYIQAGLLNRITNGMGGTIEIQYSKPELTNSDCAYGKVASSGNNYICMSIDSELEGQNATDGLIVSSLIFKDGFSDEHSKITTYEYAGGLRFFRGGYFWLPTEVEDNQVKKREYNINMYSDHYYFRGSNHGFSYVTVKTKNLLTDETLSKVKYEFSNLILPDTLTKIYTQEYLDSLPRSAANGHMLQHGILLPGFSNLTLRTGLREHTLAAEKFAKYNMGLLLNKQVFNDNNDVITEELFRYDVNHYKTVDDTAKFDLPETARGFYMKETVSFGSNPSPVTYSNAPPLVTSCIARLRHKIIKNMSGGRTSTKEYLYDYDKFDNLKSTTWNDSKGNIIQHEKFYAYEYPTYQDYLKSSMQHCVFERTLLADPSSPTEKYVLDHHLKTFNYLTGQSVYPSKLADTLGNGGIWFLGRLECCDSDYMYRLRYAQEVPKLRFRLMYNSAQVNATALNTAQNDETAAKAGGTGLATLRLAKEYTVFDERENILEIKLDEQNLYNSYVWDSRFGHRIAEVSNAKFNQIAYTSFEGLNESVACSTDYGNCTFDPAGVLYSPDNSSTPKAVTGKYIYNLNTGDIVLSNLQQNTIYELTFWADIAPSVILGTTPQTLEVIKNGNWTLYYLKFSSGLSSQITIKDNSSFSLVGFIDEVRLHPVNASMTTYTYEPLFGVSSVCDNRNDILYTEYDKHGRVSVIRDFNGKIRSKTEAKYQTNNN